MFSRCYLLSTASSSMLSHQIRRGTINILVLKNKLSLKCLSKLPAGLPVQLWGLLINSTMQYVVSFCVITE